ncbi:MAG: alanine:cation symporter family protein [Butyricicoccaceae bacterium]
MFSNSRYGLGAAGCQRGAGAQSVRQALVSATGTFWTTVVVCLMTGLVLVSMTKIRRSAWKTWQTAVR